MLNHLDLSYSIILLRRRITHSSPQGPPLEPQSNQKYQTENQICLSWFFCGLRREQPPKNPQVLNHFDSSYPITLLGWRSTHLSHHGPPLEPQSNQEHHPINQICLNWLFCGLRGKKPPKDLQIISHFYLFCFITLLG